MGIVVGATGILCVLGGYALTLSMLAKRSGWSTLARQYAAPGLTDGKRWDRVTVSAGSLVFRSRGMVSANSEGVRLALLPYLRPFHPPLFFPWRDLHRRSGHTNQVLFDVGAPAIGMIGLPLEVVERTQQR